MYGDCRSAENAPRLADVAWLPKHKGGSIRVTTSNGIPERVASLSAALDEGPSEWMPFLLPSGGGYHCRMVAGTNEPSPHAYGIAIDIAIGPAHYWLWDKQRPPAQRPAAVNRPTLPREIVAIFERHGFIWGGRWLHYDTMHFEYRPELLIGADVGPATLPR
jgi:D-alanyl-D-alanine carboxypeptidase